MNRTGVRMANVARRVAPLVVLGLALFGVTAAAAAASYRAAFYYPWYPETWTVNGQHVSGNGSAQTDDGFQPIHGFYSSTNQSVIDYHVRMLDWSKVNVAISSWWGTGSTTSQRFPSLMERTRLTGSPLKWTLYYEQEGFGNPTVAQIQSDLGYISTHFVSHRSYARLNGKPVLFVYNADDTTCELVDRWREANRGFGFFLVMKVFPGYGACPNQPNGSGQLGSWHQYGPASRADRQPGHSFSISPGFWRADEAAPRLARDPSIFDDNVRAMVASGEPWQIITTWNEWGEGTAVEAARQWVFPGCLAGITACWGRYVNILHRDGQPRSQ